MELNRPVAACTQASQETTEAPGPAGRGPRGRVVLPKSGASPYIYNDYYCAANFQGIKKVKLR